MNCPTLRYFKIKLHFIWLFNLLISILPKDFIFNNLLLTKVLKHRKSRCLEYWWPKWPFLQISHSELINSYRFALLSTCTKFHSPNDERKFSCQNLWLLFSISPFQVSTSLSHKSHLPTCNGVGTVLKSSKETTPRKYVPPRKAIPMSIK